MGYFPAPAFLLYTANESNNQHVASDVLDVIKSALTLMSHASADTQHFKSGLLANDDESSKTAQPGLAYGAPEKGVPCPCPFKPACYNKQPR